VGGDGCAQSPAAWTAVGCGSRRLNSFNSPLARGTASSSVAFHGPQAERGQGLGARASSRTTKTAGAASRPPRELRLWAGKPERRSSSGDSAHYRYRGAEARSQLDQLSGKLKNPKTLAGAPTPRQAPQSSWTMQRAQIRRPLTSTADCCEDDG